MASRWYWTTWRIPVEDRVRRLHEEMQRLPQATRERTDGTIVTACLLEARQASGVPDPETGTATQGDKPGLRAWWTGEAIEHTWSALHRAEEALLMIADDATVRQEAVTARSVVANLPASDTRTAVCQKQLDSMTASAAPLTPADREALRAIRAAINARSDERHWRERGLRNVLLVLSSCLLIALIVASLLTDARGLAIYSTCPGATKACTPFPNTAGVELFGAFGGLISVIVFVQQLQTGTGPYNLAAPQAILKIIAGAAVALFGILLVQHGILSLVSAQDSGHLIGVAVLFGFAQQAVTQAADKRAADLAGASPSTRSTGGATTVAATHPGAA